MINSARFERNLGFLSEQEQHTLHNASVAIAGAGGDGGMLAVQLARLGVGEFRLADPDPFEIENINRQAVCTDKTIGQNKAVAVADYVTDINPDAKVVTFTDGITRENTEEFVDGASLVIDETEFTMHDLGIMLAREARAKDIPVMTALNIGFGAMVTTFKPNGVKLEKLLGFNVDEPLDEIAEKPVSLDRWLPYLPNYIDLEVFEKVAKGEKSAPSIAPGVALAASLGATQAVLNLIGGGRNRRPSPVMAPKALVFDAMALEVKKVKFTRASHYRHLAVLGIRNTLKMVPKAAY